MQQQIASVKAVRLENFANKDWLAALHQRLLGRYPGGQFLYQSPFVVLVLLNTGKQWGEDDEEFFASLKTQAFFQRWEPLEAVPPKPRANSTVYEDIGYRVGSGEGLTTKQQAALFSQLGNLEMRAISAEHGVEEQRRRADSAELFSQQTVERHNHLVAILEEINRALGITVVGDYEESCTVENSETGQVLLRDVPCTELYRTIIGRGLRQGTDESTPDERET